MKLKEALEKAKKDSKKRKFDQSVDLAITVKNIDIKKSDNQFSEDVLLPNGRGKECKIGLFAGAELAKKAESLDITVVKESEIDKISKDKPKLRKLCREHDFLLAEPSMMIPIAKSLGKVLGPKGKMPKPVPPKTDAEAIVKRLKRSVNVRLRDQPVIHVPVGLESMEDDKLVENMEAVFDLLKKKLPQGAENVEKVFVKTTMGPAVRVE